MSRSSIEEDCSRTNSIPQARRLRVEPGLIVTDGSGGLAGFIVDTGMGVPTRELAEGVERSLNRRTDWRRPPRWRVLDWMRTAVG